MQVRVHLFGLFRFCYNVKGHCDGKQREIILPFRGKNEQKAECVFDKRRRRGQMTKKFDRGIEMTNVRLGVDVY